MSQLNPYALNLWLLGGSAGYAFDGGHGLAWGLLLTAGITMVASLFGR